MTWRKLNRFDDPSIPKLDNLRRAHRAGLRVPETFWATAAALQVARVERPIGGPCIVRSGSPTEDTRDTSNAGQLLSLRVEAAGDFSAALGEVIDALPRDADGVVRGAVFVQPLLRPEEAGVAFFDGFYYERTHASESNEALTAGHARGAVQRGHLERGDGWSDWLRAVWAVFGDDGDEAIDLEYARDDDGYVLLQARPALFAVARNSTLSLANHKEILGDPPSPWIVSVLCEAGESVLSFFAAVDREVARWREQYAIELGDRAWMNFSFFFRLMDHWGLPRRFVVAGVGGEGGGPEDGRVSWRRFVSSIPRLVWLQLRSMWAVLRIERELDALDRRIDAAAGLVELHRANTEAMALAIVTNFAINSVLTAVVRLRTMLGIRGAARVVTQEMMDTYARLRDERDAAARARALDAWLERFGHRGPLESDPMQPRFAELRDELLHDLAEPASVAAPEQTRHAVTSWRLLYWIDMRREWFRDQLMRRWQTLRNEILAEGERLAAAGQIDDAADVFWLRGGELDGDLRGAARAGKERVAAAARLQLPDTASRDELQRHIDRPVHADAKSGGPSGSPAINPGDQRVFPGISLGPLVVEGVVLKARRLTDLLGSGRLTPDTILVVAALEPSWAVVFPRVKGVVAEIGGELSHAAILLREANKPAVVNCQGIFAAVDDGMHIRIDGRRSLVEIRHASGLAPTSEK